MSTYMRFLYDFMEQFFSGVINIFMGVVRGFGKMFNFKAYLSILKEYSSEFSVGQWILVGALRSAWCYRLRHTVCSNPPVPSSDP